MRYSSKLMLAGVGLVLAHPVGASAWEPIEQVETYAVSGASGIELYRSIGENGPSVGVGRVIAYTDFALTWSRDYQRQGDGCVLASARPRLVITYRLPKPRGALPAPLDAHWQRFIAGVTAHEKVHGRMLVEVVQSLQAATTGLSSADDRDCNKVRAMVQEQVGAHAQEQRRRSREFDQVEMSEGGNVHQLVLALVNGT